VKTDAADRLLKDWFQLASRFSKNQDTQRFDVGLRVEQPLGPWGLSCEHPQHGRIMIITLES
jgi:hypothetical protein